VSYRPRRRRRQALEFNTVAGVRILAIDGGGIRGLIPALVLAEIERRTQRRAADLFDLIAGTSTGGILAAALTIPGPDGSPRYTADQLTRLYETEGPRIFSRSLVRVVLSAGGVLDEKYDSTGLEVALTEYLGDARLKDALTPILLTAYETERRRAFFFRSSRAAKDPAYDFALTDAAHATSAAPTYFEPVRVGDFTLVDGGLFASNPALCAYVDVVAAGREEDVTVLASLGTGAANRPIPYEVAKDWGQLGWARSVIDVLLSAQAETVDYQLSKLLEDRYVRLQVELELAKDDLDDASPENLRDLRAEADRLVRKQDRAIDDLCARLTA